MGDNNITNVGSIDLDIIRADAADGSVTVELDNVAGADFLVGNNNALVVEGDNDRVGIGILAPLTPLHVAATLADVRVNIENLTASATDNLMGIDFKALTSVGSKTAGLIITNFSDVTDATRTGRMRFSVPNAGAFIYPFQLQGNAIGFYTTAPQTKQTVTGSRGGNAALASLLTALATIGLLTDSSS